MAKKCGGPGLAVTLGIAKEVFDLEVCNRLAGSSLLKGIRKKHCDSAYQPADFADNSLGFNCPESVPCETQCGKLFGLQDPPPGAHAEP
jgi:hypothetical protein